MKDTHDAMDAATLGQIIGRAYLNLSLHYGRDEQTPAQRAILQRGIIGASALGSTRMLEGNGQTPAPSLSTLFATQHICEHARHVRDALNLFPAEDLTYYRRGDLIPATLTEITALKHTLNTLIPPAQQPMPATAEPITTPAPSQG